MGNMPLPVLNRCYDLLPFGCQSTLLLDLINKLALHKSVLA